MQLIDGLSITGTLFPHIEIRQVIWASPEGSKIKQIGHILINDSMTMSIMDARILKV